jgi:hypothetical protein
VANPLLKFMEELVTNKNSRVTFENVSPNGILLFKETSRLLVTYGSRALAQPMPHVRAAVRSAVFRCQSLSYTGMYCMAAPLVAALGCTALRKDSAPCTLAETAGAASLTFAT